MDITTNGAIVANDIFLTGNPAIRIVGDNVRFTNKAGGWIFWNPDEPQAGAVIRILGAGATIVNEAGGLIRAKDGLHLAIEGSDFADHIENYGLIAGAISLGGGNDYYFGHVDLLQESPSAFDLGSGDDQLVFDASDENFFRAPDIVGGDGFDSLTVSGFSTGLFGRGGTFHLGATSGLERIILAGVGAAAGLVEIEAVNTAADLQLGISMSARLFGYDIFPAAVGAILMNGGSLDLGAYVTTGAISGGAGAERITFASTDTAATIGAVALGDGADSFVGPAGAGGALDVHGGDGADFIAGGSAGDSLAGDEGNDSIRGNDGGDAIAGGGGADVIAGGLGADMLTGGGGADRFLFDAALGAGNIDAIADFAVGIDKILLAPSIFTNIAFGGLNGFQFFTGTQAHDADDRIIYNPTTGALLFDSDGTGAVAAIQFATLAPGLALGAGDFALALASAPTLRIAGWPITRVSVGPAGGEADGSSVNPSFSPNGRFILFESNATNLIAGDTNGVSDIFIKNLITGSVTRLSTDSLTNQADGGSFHPLYSADGTKVIFESLATNLAPGDTNGATDLFIKDFTTGATSLVSTSAAGLIGNGASTHAAFSADGGKIVFVSAASNLVAGDFNGAADIFVKDLATGALTLVSAGANGASAAPVFSPDGTKVLFQSDASNLVAGDTNGTTDLFIKDLVTGAITRVSTTSGGAEANGASAEAGFSADGTRIVFQSAATNLYPGDGNAAVDIFMKDLATGAITLISTSSLGDHGNMTSAKPVFSPDGTKIVFYSFATNLVDGDNNGDFDIFVKDLTNNQTIRISVSAAGLAGGGGPSLTPVFSADGASIAFFSQASNLVAGDNNGASATYDVFVVELGTHYTENGAAAVIAPNVIVADDSDSYIGGTLQAMVTGGGDAGDRITLDETGGVVRAGNQVIFGGIAVGDVVDGGGPQILRIALNGNATDAAVDAIARALRYSTSSENPAEGARTVTVTLTDGGLAGFAAGSASFTRDIVVAAVNDAPVLHASAGLTQAIEGADGPGTPVAIDPGLTITDVDASRITDATIGVIVGSTGDKLGFVNDNAALYGDIHILADISSDGGLYLHSDAGATLAQWQNALRAVTYTTVSDDPIGGERTISFILRDSDASDHGILSNMATRQVVLAPADDTPVNHLPGTQTVDENHALAFSVATGNAITISDVDSTVGSMWVTVSVAEGSLTLTSGYLIVTGEGTGTLVLHGSVDQLNAALDGLTYTPLANANGARTITITTGDGGFTGSPNLVVNYDADTGPAAADFNSAVTPAGWTAAGGQMTAIRYDVPGDGNLQPDFYGGHAYFAGGPGGGADSAIRQTIDVSSQAADIDAGCVQAYLFGQLGGRGGSADTMTLTLRFLGADARALGTLVLPSGGVSPETGVVGQEGQMLVPVGTRGVEVLLSAHNGDGGYNDAYADTLYLTLSRTDRDAIGVNIAPDANDIVHGTTGADALAAGPGDDIYYVDNAGDTIAEANGEGFDNVLASLSYRLNAGAYVEILSTTSHAGTAAIDLTGNEIGQLLLGNAGMNILKGGGGADILAGFGGNDTYFVDADDVVREDVGGGFDYVVAIGTYTLNFGAEIELLGTTDNAGTAAIDLTGNNFAQVIIGNAGMNSLRGGPGGGDVLVGFGGDDTYFVDADDQVREDVGGGFDYVVTTTSYALNFGAEIELLGTTDNAGTDAIDLTGNNFAQVIIGNAGMNSLRGGPGGGDVLVGFGGDDTYFVDADDQVREDAGGGFDYVVASSDYALNFGAEIELLGTVDNNGLGNFTLTGNNFTQIIIGNAGDNVLNGGGGGADILNGLAGNDTLFVDADDIVREEVGNGYDYVVVKSSYTLNAGAEIELMTTTDNAGTSAFNLTGNEFANIIQGNAGANVLNGGLGADRLVGLGGADSFAFTTALGNGNVDTLTDFAHGTDKILLDHAIFTGLGAGALGAGAFVTGSAAVDGDDRIIYNAATGALFFDADGSGSGAAIQFATLQPGLGITASDFQII